MSIDFKRIEGYDPKKYEVEYKITNKLQFFANMQKYLTPQSFEHVIIYYSEPVRHRFESIRIFEELDGSKRVETKRIRYVATIPLDTYPYSMKLKISTERPNPPEEKYNIINMCHRYRMSFTRPDFPFRVDLSLRVFPTSPASLLPTFTEEDLIHPSYKESTEYGWVYDMEFEVIKYITNATDAFYDLCKLIKQCVDEHQNSGGIQVMQYSVGELLGGDDEDVQSISSSSSSEQPNKLLQQLVHDTFDFTRTPQVSVMTNRIIQTVDLHNFVYLEKTDGLRTLIVCRKGKYYTYTHKDGIQQLTHDGLPKCSHTFVIDTELKDGKYYIFDVYYVDGDVRERDFKSRMSMMTQLLEPMSREDSILITKSYKEAINPKLSYTENIKQLIDHAMTVREGVDGIVFQSKEGYMNWLRQDYQYKLKPLELTTTDYLYKYIPHRSCYYLYCGGNFAELIFNLRARPRCMTEAYSIFGWNVKNLPKQDIYNILFDTPLFNQMYTCSPTDDELKKLTDISQTAAEGCLDGLIVETRFDPNTMRQIPVRVRSDKSYPNSYRVGLGNACILFSPPVPPNEYYFQSITPENVQKVYGVDDGEKLISAFHIINQKIRNHTFETLYAHMTHLDFTSYITALDLCGGRGSDLQRLVNLGVNNVIAVDSDREALVSYSIRGIFYKSFKPPLHIPTPPAKRLNLNCICRQLGQADDMKLIVDIKERYEFKQCDIVVIDYALHYICNSDDNLINLVNIISAIKAPTTLILVNFYDGDKILKRVEAKSKTATFGIFKIEVDGMSAKMPLPTIDQSGYREEPLLLNKHLGILQKHGWTIVHDYYPLISNPELANPDYPDITEYLQCIRSVIFKAC